MDEWILLTHTICPTHQIEIAYIFNSSVSYKFWWFKLNIPDPQPLKWKRSKGYGRNNCFCLGHGDLGCYICVVVNVLISNSVPPAQIANNISGSLSQIHQFRGINYLMLQPNMLETILNLSFGQRKFLVLLSTQCIKMYFFLFSFE